MTKTRILTESPRDYIRITKSAADGLITLTNDRNGKTTTVPLDASAWQRREAIKSLQDAVDDPFAGVKANEGLDRMAGAKPAERADDPEPYVPFSPGRLRDKALTAHAQWAARRDAAAARQRELADIDRLSDKVAAKLAAQRQVEEQQAEDYWSWESALKRAESAQPETGAANAE